MYIYILCIYKLLLLRAYNIHMYNIKHMNSIIMENPMIRAVIIIIIIMLAAAIVGMIVVHVTRIMDMDVIEIKKALSIFCCIRVYIILPKPQCTSIPTIPYFIAIFSFVWCLTAFNELLELAHINAHTNTQPLLRAIVSSAPGYTFRSILPSDCL